MLHSFPFVLKYKYKYKASYERNFCRKEIEKKEMLSMPQFTCLKKTTLYTCSINDA